MCRGSRSDVHDLQEQERQVCERNCALSPRFCECLALGGLVWPERTLSDMQVSAPAKFAAPPADGEGEGGPTVLCTRKYRRHA